MNQTDDEILACLDHDAARDDIGTVHWEVSGIPFRRHWHCEKCGGDLGYAIRPDHSGHDRLCPFGILSAMRDDYLALKRERVAYYEALCAEDPVIIQRVTSRVLARRERIKPDFEAALSLGAKLTRAVSLLVDLKKALLTDDGTNADLFIRIVGVLSENGRL